MDLALNNLQRLICHKTQRTNQYSTICTVKRKSTNHHHANHQNTLQTYKKIYIYIPKVYKPIQYKLRYINLFNTNYQKREGKLWTYTYANNNKAQIDYVLINKKWKNSAMNCEAYSSFEGVSTDHRIVTAKIRLSLRKNAKRTATTKHYDWALLNNKDIRDKYVLELRNRFETLQEKTEKSTPNDEYENFVNAHLEAAAKYIPTKLKTKYRVPWETLAVREKRALVKTASKNYRKNPTNTNALKLKTAQ